MTGAVTVGMVTTMVTASVCVPVDETMAMVPVQLVAVANEDGSTETVKFEFDGPAVKLPVGVRVNQLLLVHVCSDIWAVTFVLVFAVTVRVWEGGAAVPTTALKVRAEALKVSWPETRGATTIVTGTMRTPLTGFMTMAPVQVVPGAIPEGLTETVKFVAVVPAVKVPFGERASQLKLAQLCSVSWAVAVVSKNAVTTSVWEAGAAAPATELNVREEGLTVRTDVGGLIRVRVTVTVCVPELALTVIVPVQRLPTLSPA
jgi:hypothetical protein